MRGQFANVFVLVMQIVHAAALTTALMMPDQEVGRNERGPDERNEGTRKAGLDLEAVRSNGSHWEDPRHFSQLQPPRTWQCTLGQGFVVQLPLKQMVKGEERVKKLGDYGGKGMRCEEGDGSK
ncbi:unnamed protein product [Tetraodon nigroviridis]|uniref:(spotted green pufferfish) hypothetical protein n=1 Tax=Tetraodon nigroviridis TaxID=99883 RepID=Q4RK19_TETNG|nr:unnamed protein product [Tetraodon nigroviridis]